MPECTHIDHVRFGPTEADYARFDVERQAVVDRLVEAIHKQREEAAMSVLRCKMRVTEVAHYKNEDGTTSQEVVKLAAVSGPDGTDNAQWSKWTPSAQFSITINNPDAFNKLSNGHEFYVDFTAAEKAQSANV